MAFGDLRGVVTGGATTIPVGGAMAASGSVSVSVGDLLFCAVTERNSSLTVTAVTDSLGGAAYTARTGSSSGNVSTRLFYKIADVGGTLTAMTGAGTASNNDFAIEGAVFAGPFESPALDKDVVDATDAASPFTCTATGVLAQAVELVVVTCSMVVAQTLAATAPNLLAGQALSAAAGTALSVSVAIGRQVTAATTSIAPAFTGTNPTAAIETTLTFKQHTPVSLNAVAAPTGVASLSTAAILNEVGGTTLTAVASISPAVTHTPTVIGTRTNYIRNNSMQGAVAGSPGTNPTNWGMTGSVNSLTRQIVAIGTENGIDYIDVRWSGTPSVSSFLTIQPDSTTQIVAANGEIWAGSFYVELAAGTTTNAGFTTSVSERDGTGTSLASTNQTFTPLSSLVRVSATRTNNNASTAFEISLILVTYTIALPIDFTLRIGWPQLERNSVSDPIRTAGTAVTVGPDLLFSSVSSLVGQSTIGKFIGATLNGDSSVTVSAILKEISAASLTGAASLSTSAILSELATATLTVSSILSIASTHTPAIAASFTGAGSLVSAAIEKALAAANLTGEGQLLSTALEQIVAAVNFTGVGQLSATTFEQIVASAAFTAIANLSSTASERIIASASFTATSNLLTPSVELFIAAAQLSGSSNLSTAILERFIGIANFHADAAIFIEVGHAPRGIVNFLGLATLFSESDVLAGAVTGTGILVVDAATIYGFEGATGTGILESSASSLAGSGISESIGTGVLVDGSASITGTGEANFIYASGALAAQTSTLSGTANAFTVAVGNLIAQSSSLTGIAISTVTGTGALVSRPSKVRGREIINWLTGVGYNIVGDDDVGGEFVEEVFIISFGIEEFFPVLE